MFLAKAQKCHVGDESAAYQTYSWPITLLHVLANEIDFRQRISHSHGMHLVPRVSTQSVRLVRKTYSKAYCLGAIIKGGTCSAWDIRSVGGA